MADNILQLYHRHQIIHCYLDLLDPACKYTGLSHCLEPGLSHRNRQRKDISLYNKCRLFGKPRQRHLDEDPISPLQDSCRRPGPSSFLFVSAKIPLPKNPIFSFPLIINLLWLHLFLNATISSLHHLTNDLLLPFLQYQLGFPCFIRLVS